MYLFSIFHLTEQRILLSSNYWEELGYAYPNLGGIDLVFVGPEVDPLVPGKPSAKLRFTALRSARNDAHDSNGSAGKFGELLAVEHGPSPTFRAAFYKGTLQVHKMGHAFL